MNKKFLSAILFGALMITSTGTFVSCKDYDDDIENLQTQIDANAKSIADLKAAFDGANYVTDVTVSGSNLIVTTKTGGAKTIALPACECDDEVGSLAEVKDGELYIDGEATGIKVYDGEAVKVVDGEWAILQADGTYKSTNIPASGVTAVKNDKGQWVLTVYNAEGEKESIILPTAASLITEIEMKGYLTPTAYKKYIFNANDVDGYAFNPVSFDNNGYNTIEYNFSIVAGGKYGALNNDQKAWNNESMTKKLTPGQALSTVYSNFLVRIAPATVDASELDFSFVNSQMGGLDVELGTPVAYNGLLAAARATHENGLWMIPVSAKEGVVYDNAAHYMSQFQVYNENFVEGYNNEYADIYFALKEKEGFVSNFDMKFKYNQYTNLDAIAYSVSATLNKTTAVTFNRPQNVYDAHIHFADADVLRWGIEYSGNGVDFTITKLNDELSIDGFDATVHFVTLKGQVKSQPIHVNVLKNTYTTVYESSNIKINSNNDKNNFTVSLDNMFNTLGSEASTLWKADVAYTNISYWRNPVGIEDRDQEVINEHISVNFLDVNGNVLKNEDLGKAVTVKVNVKHEAALDRTKQYYALINFCRNESSHLINTIKVPFTISIPTLAELMNKEQVVFGGTSNGTAVLNEYDYKLDNNAVQYSMKYAFNGLDKSFDAVNMSFIVDAYQTIKIDGADVTMSTLVKIDNANQESAIVKLHGDAGKKHAYNKPINIQIASGAKYLNTYAYTDAERAEAAFTLKLVSPIEQGTLTAKDGESAVIEVVATEDGTAKLKESDLIAKTYAGIAYNVFMTKGTAAGAATAYSSPYLKPVAVKFTSTNTNVFKVDEVGTPATIKADGTITAEGYTTITPMNVAYTDAVPVKITVKDVWNYSKEVEVLVKVKPSVD